MKRKILLLIFTLQISQAQESAQIFIQKAFEAFKTKNKSMCIQNFRKALELEPNSFTALFNLAKAYQYDGDTLEAAQLFEQCYKINPAHRETIINYAKMLTAMGKFDEGQYILEQLFFSENPQQDAILSLSFLALRNGDWANAKELLKIHKDWTKLDSLWWFNEDITNKIILLDLAITPGSNGIGDAIQMLQYAEFLKKGGARVIARTHSYMIRLFKCCPYIDDIVSIDNPKPFFHKEIPFGLQAFAILAAQELPKRRGNHQYIFPHQDLMNYWNNQLSLNTNFKIGICWNSSLFGYYFSGTSKTAPRSIELNALAPLAEIAGVNFYSLQKYNGNLPDLANNFTIHQFPSWIDTEDGRFMDTAAIIKNLDLVITVDTSIAHLAGALGIPTWVILLPESDWRWQRDSTTTPWYPSMRLYRRKDLNDLSHVIERIKHDLELIIAQRNS